MKKRFLWLALAMAVDVGAGVSSVSAFPVGGGVPANDVDTNFTIGACSGIIHPAWTDQSLYVILQVAGANHVPSGAIWSVGSIMSPGQGSITRDDIASCLSIPAADVLSFAADGADGAYDTDNYVGFAFELAQASGDLAAGWHEYKIGTTSLIPPDTTAPTVTITGPTGSVTGDFTATFTFSEDVTGFDASDVTVVNGTKGTFSGSGTTYTLVISPDPGATVSVSVAAGLAADAASNLNTVSNTFTVQAGSVASAFDSARDVIRDVLVGDATRSLSSSLTFNRNMVADARGRFLAGQAGDTPFGVSGSLDANGLTLSSKGTFFGQTGLADGSRRLVFGDFDVQHDSDTGSTTATLNGRMAWERMISDKTLLGYFIGGELARSSLEGSFAGSQNRVGVTLGGYGVHQLGATTFADGFITLGAGRNNLAMTSEVLDLTSNYTTRTATVGGALSGVFDHGKYELRPELAFSYGKTWIGNVGFTGSAYGLVDNTLNLDAGAVAIANLTLRPEVVLALDAGRVADSQSQLSFAPRLVCERRQAATTTKDCGGGAEIGLTSHSANGLSNATFRVIMDRVGASTQSSVAINLERRF